MQSHSLKSVDVCVLAYRSPLVGAYLCYMRLSGFVPRKIIDLRLHDPGRRYRVLRAALGARWAGELLFRSSCRHAADGLDSALVEGLRQPAGSAREWFHVEYRDFAPEVERVYAEDLNSEAVARALERQDCKIFLFTGGGLLRRSLLSIAGAKFIHVHPAVVPDIRGADGLLWSMLLRGRPGASCFYMNEGIDTGDVIHVKEFDPPRFDPGAPGTEAEQLYRALLVAYDPMLRASTWVEVLQRANGVGLGQLPARRQPLNAGRTYFFMHPGLRGCVLDVIFGPRTRKA